jgi:hypothetical protein
MYELYGMYETIKPLDNIGRYISATHGLLLANGKQNLLSLHSLYGTANAELISFLKCFMEKQKSG